MTSKANFHRELMHWAFKFFRGKTDESTARVQMQLYLERNGYTAAQESVGSMRDLGSACRLHLQLSTFRMMMHGAMMIQSGMGPGALRLHPAWELIHFGFLPGDSRNWVERWQKVGGVITADGRMIAMKQDAIWEKLGNKENFADALDINHPPFAWRCGMNLRPVKYQELKRLGLIDLATFRFPETNLRKLKLSDIRKIWQTVLTLKNFDSWEIRDPK